MVLAFLSTKNYQHDYLGRSRRSRLRFVPVYAVRLGRLCIPRSLWTRRPRASLHVDLPSRMVLHPLCARLRRYASHPSVLRETAKPVYTRHETGETADISQERQPATTAAPGRTATSAAAAPTSYSSCSSSRQPLSLPPPST
jgi:hypothetical protein